MNASLNLPASCCPFPQLHTSPTKYEVIKHFLHHFLTPPQRFKSFVWNLSQEKGKFLDSPLSMLREVRDRRERERLMLVRKKCTTFQFFFLILFLGSPSPPQFHDDALHTVLLETRKGKILHSVKLYKCIQAIYQYPLSIATMYIYYYFSHVLQKVS